MPKQGVGDPCPSCGRDRSPGPTARFRDFVETYAGAEGAAARAEMYRFRSTLVHGGGLHSLDIPDAWGALVASSIKHRELHDTALAVSRTVVRTWFLDPAGRRGTQEHEDGRSSSADDEARLETGGLDKPAHGQVARRLAVWPWLRAQPARLWRLSSGDGAGRRPPS